MKRIKKLKYKLDKKKLRANVEKDLEGEDIFKEMLKSKLKRGRPR